METPTRYTTIEHTTYGSAYSAAAVTLCAGCAAANATITGPVESYRSEDPNTCEECGSIYDARLARAEVGR